jgi:DNA (cytosine-5)-methyltransferase 3A
MSNENRETMSQELFNIKPVLINSALVTAQSRKRLYFVGCLQDDGTYKTIDIPQPENKGIMLKDTLESSLSYTDKSYALTASYNGAVFWNTLEKKQRSMILEPICDKNDIKYIGCAIRGRHTGNSIQQKLEFRKDDKSNCITTVHKDSLVSERIGQIGNGGQGQRIYSINAKSVTLSANGGGQGGKIGMYKVDLPDGEYIVRKLMPIECERLQGYPDNYTIGSNTQRYKMLGNSFTVPVICHILQSLVS